MTRLQAYGADHSLVRLGQLREHLNDRYGCDLARPHLADHRAGLTVSRWHSVSDVVVAVICDETTEVFHIAVYTAVAWAEYKEPFVCTERDAVQRAAAYVLQFVPETPCT